MTRQLWAPWRLEYVQSADEQPGCIFCAARDGEDAERLVVHRSERAFVLLNRFPYASGHLMIAPARHAGEFGELADEEALELHRLAARALGALRGVFSPDGFNLGWNIGRVAGAGVPDHVHLHVVPRWAADNNFMPVVGGTRVLPQSLEDSWRELSAAFASEGGRFAPPAQPPDRSER